jgi:hypothetical protein
VQEEQHDCCCRNDEQQQNPGSCRLHRVPFLRGFEAQASRTGLIYSALASVRSMSPASMAGLTRGISSRIGLMRPVQQRGCGVVNLKVGRHGAG